jgi:hypothetical protein|tara:strand:+ start:39988 stop:40158 length:171 start_codon:yes stop_codon:yes gene_type:complete
MIIDLPVAVRRDLAAYAGVLGGETGQVIHAPTKLIPPMAEGFMATDRAFAKMKRTS